MTTTQLTAPARIARTSTVFLAAPGILAGTIAIYMVLTDTAPQDLSSWASRLSYGLFAAYLTTSILGANTAVRARLAPRAVGWLIGAGYGLVLTAVIAQTVTASEPPWFIFVAGPGQLLAIAGFLTWAVWGKRNRLFGLSVSLLCAVGGITAIIGSEAGLSVLIAGFWFAMTALRDKGIPS